MSEGPSVSQAFPPVAPAGRLALLTAPRDLDGWLRTLREAPIPVLPDTANVLETLRKHEERVDARRLSEAFAEDPLMTLKILVHVGRKRSVHATGQVETVTAALVLLGIAPFFRDFGPQPSVQGLLADEPDALEGLAAVLRRSRRAARFALAFAVHRQDHDVEVIHEAALLHDFTEMLLWCHAPSLALALRARQAADANLRSAVAQRQVLHVTLADLQQALMHAWRLPQLLVHVTDESESRDPSARCVALATRLARHTAEGWENAALPDDVRDIGALLNLAPAPALQLLRQIDG